MAAPSSFTDLVLATARQKHAAAKARTNPDLLAEKPRDAIFHALQIVSDSLATDGFIFSPSGRKFVRKHGDFTFEILVQSDRNNIAGQRAAIWVHVAAYSRLSTAWYNTHCGSLHPPNFKFRSPIFANSLGYLLDPPAWMEWDFADQVKRTATAENLINSIRLGAFPIFSTFDGPVEDIAALADHDWAPPQRVLTYLLATEHADLADNTLRQYLDGRAEFRRRFEPLHWRYVEQGVPTHRTDTFQDLAAFTAVTGYPWGEAD